MPPPLEFPAAPSMFREVWASSGLPIIAGGGPWSPADAPMGVNGLDSASRFSKASEMERVVPITRVMESVRRLVVRTSTLAGIHWIYTAVYRAAVRALVREVSANECTLSIFSRNSYVTGSFVPGQSDIDLIVVIRDDLGPSGVKSYLADLYVTCERLRRRFPMLNQFPVYTRRGFMAAYRLGPLRLETDAWRCEWGEDGPLFALEEPPGQHPLEAVTRGAQIYVNGFHSNLRAALRAGKTHSTMALERSGRKVERAFSAIAPVGDLGTAGPIPEVITRVLNATTRVLEDCTLDPPPYPWARVSPQDERLPEVEIDPEPVSSGITGIITSRNGSVPSYILSTPVTVGATQDALTLARPQISESAPVLLMSEPLLTFFLRHINPMLYYRLQAVRNVRGDDVVGRILPPSQLGVRRFFCFEAAQMLQLPTRLASPQLPTHRQLRRHERRRARLFHFLQHDAILLDGHAPLPVPSEAPQPDDLLDAILADLPKVLDKLNDCPTGLLLDELDTSSDAA